MPPHLRKLFGILWENRKALPHAWRVLNHGFADSRSLGCHGLHDNLLGGVHLCRKRLALLQLNTMPALDTSRLGNVADLRKMAPQKLAALGRLPHPMLRRHGDRGFAPLDWDDALAIAGQAIHETIPHEMAFFAGSHGLTNEVYYVVQKLARALGTNNVNLCSRHCHAAAVAGLKETLGVGAPSCSLADFIGTDLLILCGVDLENDQPLTARWLRRAKKAGTQVVVVNPKLNSGMQSPGWPSFVSSALWGTGATDEFFPVEVGGDLAFINGVLKELIESKRVERDYVDQHTTGFDSLTAALERQSWQMLEQRSGVSRGRMQRFADLYSRARTAVIAYGSGLTRHPFGVDNVKALVNLALARAMLGREKCGIMPMRGQSDAQGATECGAAPDKFPGGLPIGDDSARRFSNLWHHPVPATPGLNAPQAIEAAHDGELKFIYSISGNLFETMADPDFVASALGKVRVRLHQDFTLDKSMLLDAQDAVLLLPSQTRHEQRGGGTSTSAERRICFTPEIPGHAVGKSRPAWEIPVEIGRKSMPNGDKLFPFDDTQSIREEMARVMPLYQGIEKLNREGDQLQWGGPILFKDGFTNMPNHRALFTVLDPPTRRAEMASVDAWREK
jgi:molybdopterin-dependent oxidoreductase alpha subunit